MRNSLLLVLACASCLPLRASEPPFRMALPGYRFEFPRDHFNHPEFRTEWWYYTGNLRAGNGQRFGFELTFFRHALQPSAPEPSNVWDVRDVWMAHLALSDIDRGHFRTFERINRSGSGVAGIDASAKRVWNGNWSVQWTDDSTQRLQAFSEAFSYDFTLHSVKPPVIHGENGVSQKSPGAGNASHYVSLTRLVTQGSLTLKGKRYTVEGLAWMDHEFFSHSLGSAVAGWDWFSLQFDDGSELMLYRLRRTDGTVEPLSSGTYVEKDGRSRRLKVSEFDLQPGRRWKSPATSAEYPVEWKVRVPSLGIDCQVTTKLDGQELQAQHGGATPTYWEGAIDIAGSRTGRGYLEMTGYASPVRVQ